ncbi:hypothetical protein T484DRAFT_1818507 [Baffinella frigidus]|nr:hypothetical protein T484DRAFT_1818507 [Cryptophyta sp. CCMP2293]
MQGGARWDAHPGQWYQNGVQPVLAPQLFVQHAAPQPPNPPPRRNVTGGQRNFYCVVEVPSNRPKPCEPEVGSPVWARNLRSGAVVAGEAYAIPPGPVYRWSDDMRAPSNNWATVEAIPHHVALEHPPHGASQHPTPRDGAAHAYPVQTLSATGHFVTVPSNPSNWCPALYHDAAKPQPGSMPT